MITTLLSSPRVPAFRRRRPSRNDLPEAGAARVTELFAPCLAAPSPMVFTGDAFLAIRSTVGTEPAETGGPFGGRRGSGVVEHVHPDATARRNAVQYYPDQRAVNALLRESWNPAGVNLLGFVHSHPRGAVRPSRQDVRYATEILRAIPELDRLLLPIVQSAADSRSFSIGGFAATRHGHQVRLEDVPVVVVPAGQRPDLTAFPEFARVHDAYHLPTMAGSRVIAVGCGGSAAFLEDMARAGVGEFVLIDPDRVALENVGTQQVYRSDLGRGKADAIAARLVDVSPHARVWVVRAWLDDLADDAMRRLVSGWLPGSTAPRPTGSLLCGFTDSFAAQARVNRLGLHLGVPVLGATVYVEGRGVELTFAAPGVTPACIRCAQRSRYAAHLEQGYVNGVTSHGTPISATARLNALKLPVALALLHHVSDVPGQGHPGAARHRRLLDVIGDRNLVLVSLDPDIATTVGLGLFGSLSGGDLAGRLPVDTTAWLRQQPDRPDTGFPECADCGGTGDLTTSMGRFVDTRPMPLWFGEFRW